MNKGGEQYSSVILDNAEEESFIHPSSLQSVRPSEPAEIIGVNGDSKILNLEGDLPGFFSCLTSPDTEVNILAQHDVEVIYPISWEQGKKYTAHMNDGHCLEFRKEGKLYVAEFEQTRHNQVFYRPPCQNNTRKNNCNELKKQENFGETV